MTDDVRSFISIRGDDRIAFLQGILTQDVRQLGEKKIQFAALLSPQGKILHDMFLVADGDSILLDTAATYKDTLLKRLQLYKLRAKVTIAEVGERPSSVASLPDPRHPKLPPYTPRGSHLAPLALGIPELGRDFEPDTLTALDAGYDLLHAISFTKGCYVGQEVTARMHYKNIARRGFFILERDVVPVRLALLRFDDVRDANFQVTVDNMDYRARLPAWMQPKWQQFQHAQETQ